MRHAFLHIGDTHLQSGHPRNADRLASLDQIVTHALSLDNLAAILWPGDIFHARPSTQDRNDVAERLLALAAHGPVLMCPGNHDEPGSLDIFAKLKTTYPVHVITRPQVFMFHTRTGMPASCFVFPWPHKAGLVAAGVEAEAVGQTAESLLDPLFMVSAAELEEKASQGHITLMIAHASIGGAISSVGQPQIGKGIELSPGQLARLGPIYKGFSHIHLHQELHGAVYAGSVSRQDFGENEDKGVVIATFDGDERAWSWEFVKLDVPKQFRVNGTLTPEGFEPDSGEDAEAALDCKGADVRVRYRYRRSEAGVINTAHIERLFAGARSLQLEPDPITEAEVRAPEIVAARTLEEKVQAYCARQQVEYTDTLAEKVADLQAPVAAPEGKVA